MLPSISMVDSAACLRYAECSRAPDYITNGYDCPLHTISCAWRLPRLCLSVGTQPLTATGAPAQTSTIPCHTRMQVQTRHAIVCSSTCSVSNPDTFIGLPNKFTRVWFLGTQFFPTKKGTKKPLGKLIWQPLPINIFGLLTECVFACNTATPTRCHGCAVLHASVFLPCFLQ